jgi:hypothetical protein
LSTDASIHSAELIFFNENGTIQAKIESGNGSLFGGTISVFDPHGILAGGFSVAEMAVIFPCSTRQVIQRPLSSPAISGSMVE